jgi:excisionase family DNA binding protein
MAKMFYTLDEAAQRLSTSEQGIKDLVASGDLTEYRDSGKNLVFKVDQVDRLLAKDDDGIRLADDSAIGLAPDVDAAGAAGGPASGRIPAEESKEKSGISIFDEADEQADPLAATQITAAQGGDATVESMGSGSGLMEMTREGDDTSLGADLLAGVYEGEQGGGETAGTSGLFEPAGAASDVSAGQMVGGPMLIAAEPFDPVWSGIGGGLALGTVLVLGLALVISSMAILNAGAGALAGQLLGFGGLAGLAGALVGVLLVIAAIGFVLGRRG